MTNELGLAEYLANRNAAKRAWVAEDPKNRWAMYIVEDLEHWKSYGVETVAQFEHYMAVATVCDFHKDVWGYKPSWAHLQSLSLQELEGMIEQLKKDAEAQREAREDEDDEIQAYYKEQMEQWKREDAEMLLRKPETLAEREEEAYWAR